MDEKIKAPKKQWQQPELVVLTRSNPEEMVLAACKGDSIPHVSAQNTNSTQCYVNTAPCIACALISTT